MKDISKRAGLFLFGEMIHSLARGGFYVALGIGKPATPRQDILDIMRVF